MLPPGRDAGADAGTEQSTRSPQLARELSDFLIEFSIAMHKHAIYPPGHPLLTQAVDAVYRTLLALLVERPVLSIGVARRQLIIEGVATESVHPLLAELAGKLHRHHIGALKFIRGLSRDEVSEALATIGIEPQRDELPVGMQPALIERRWANVKLFPLTYDRLELIDDDEDAPDDGRRRDGMRDGRAAQLWMGLAQAAIAGDRSTPIESDSGALEPVAVAHAIDEHGREQAYDQVIVGYLLQIADEVRQSGAREGAGLKRRISRLVGALQPDTLRRLLDMGGDAGQRHRFVLDAAQGMSVDAVVELVQAAAAAEGQTISRSLVRMLTKLASHASEGDSMRGHAADGALREHVTRLVGAWKLDDPNPVTYSQALERMAQRGERTVRADPDGDAMFPCEPSRIVTMALAVDVTGDAVRRATMAMLEAAQLGELLDLLDEAPSAATAAPAIWDVVAAAEPLRALLASPRPDHRLVQRLVQRTGRDAAGPLLDALAATTDPFQRERVIALLITLGAGIAPAIAGRLTGAESALARDLLAVLGKLDLPSPPAVVPTFLMHDDPLLRREAARLLMLYADSKEAAVLAAVRDPDPRVASVGLLAAQEGCSPRIAVTIRQRVENGEIADDIMRAAAVRAVCAGIVPGRSDDETLQWLLRRVLQPARVLRRVRLAPPSAELLAALSALATRWDNDPRARTALELARTDESASVRDAVAKARPTPRRGAR